MSLLGKTRSRYSFACLKPAYTLVSICHGVVDPRASARSRLSKLMSTLVQEQYLRFLRDLEMEEDDAL